MLTTVSTRPARQAKRKLSATAEALAAELVRELVRTGRHTGGGAVLVQPAGALVTIGCVVKIEATSRSRT